MCTQTGVKLRPTSFRSNLNSTGPSEIGLVSLLALTDSPNHVTCFIESRIWYHKANVVPPLVAMSFPVMVYAYCSTLFGLFKSSKNGSERNSLLSLL